MRVCVCVALVDLEAVGWMSQPRERGETPGLSLKVFLHLLNNSSVLSLFFFLTVPWNWWPCTITHIYELSKELRTFVMAYPGACLSSLHCLEASLHSTFRFLERSLCLHPPCLGTSYAVPQPLAFPASPSP